MSSDPKDFGRYVVLERIGAGGMAEIYRAISRGASSFEKTVALKQILADCSDSPEMIARFEDEARICSQLVHPNIAQVFAFEKTERGSFLVMELIEGKSLEYLLTRKQGIEPSMRVPLALFLVKEVCRGLHYAHTKTDAVTGEPLFIVHRDLSPSNIALTYEGGVKIFDFGMAKYSASMHRTQAGLIQGTLKYLSPEMLHGRPLDARSDLFSLGIIFFELLTGSWLFDGASDFEILEKIRSASVPSPSSLNPKVSEAVDAVVSTLLRRNPSDRYQNALEVQLDLEAILVREYPTLGHDDLVREASELLAKERQIEESRVRKLYARWKASDELVLGPNYEVTALARAPRHATQADLQGASRVGQAIAGALRLDMDAKSQHGGWTTPARTPASIGPRRRSYVPGVLLALAVVSAVAWLRSEPKWMPRRLLALVTADKPIRAVTPAQGDGPKGRIELVTEEDASIYLEGATVAEARAGFPVSLMLPVSESLALEFEPHGREKEVRTLTVSSSVSLGYFVSFAK